MKIFSNIIINAVLLICAIFFTLLTIEIILFNFTNLRNDEAKISIRTNYCYGNCYTSNPRGYFPFSLNILKDRQCLKQILESDTIENIFKRAPYCIVYDCKKRMSGFFPNRKNEVAIIGDSFVFGEGVKEEDTLGYLVGLKFTGANFRNYGRTGADIEEIYNIFLQVLEEGKTKDVIYFYNLNDVLTSPEIVARQKYIIDFQNIRWSRVERKNDYFTRLLSKSTIYHLIENLIVINKESRLTVRNYLDMYFSHANSSGVSKTLSFLESMNNIAKKRNVNFFVVIYPLLYKDILGRYPFLSIHAFLEKACKKYNISCIDLYPALGNKYSLNEFKVHPVDYHPNGLANKTVAEYLFKKEGFLNGCR